MIHTNKKLFGIAIRETADNLKIKDYLIEKDYWISLVLKRLSESKYVNSVVFKGGTSLSKGHKLINRFSEDIDIAVIINQGVTGNQIKSLIRTVEKEITGDLLEVDIKGVTSKGSRFRKSIYQYPEIFNQKSDIPNTIIVEINSFANPFPYSKVFIQSMIGEYLEVNKQTELIKQHQLNSFEINVLNKEQTLIEKLVSLIRFSFSESPTESILGKIRHFYDIYYLLEDDVCKNYVGSEEFKTQFKDILTHDQKQFDEPKGWTEKQIQESPLISNFDLLWSKLKDTYTNELSILAYSEIPDEKKVAKIFGNLISILSSID